MRKHHIFTFLRTITLKKIFNFYLLWLSFYLAKWLKKPIIWGKPATLSIEPTTACNLRCPECPSGLRSFTRDTGNLKTETLKTIIEQTHQNLLSLTFYFQGEPFINPEFLNMVTLAAKKNIYTITSTNAHFITEKVAEKTVKSGLHKLIISIDGTTQEVYEQYRIAGNLNKVIEGTKNMVNQKKALNSKTPELVFQFLVVKPNEHQIESAVELAKELGVDDIVFKTAQIYNYQNGNELIPDNEKYSRYKKLSTGKYILKNKLLNQCWRMWQGSVITWDGKVVPCCFDKDAHHQLGNIHQQHYYKIWKSPQYNNFRKSLLTSRKEIDICTNCSEGTQIFT